MASNSKSRRGRGASPVDWPAEARLVVKGFLGREGVTYAALAERLQAMEVNETESSIANKMARGTFPLVFLLQCASALGKHQITIDIDER